jgi:hypothetical protein
MGRGKQLPGRKFFVNHGTQVYHLARDCHGATVEVHADFVVGLRLCKTCEIGLGVAIRPKCGPSVLRAPDRQQQQLKRLKALVTELLRRDKDCEPRLFAFCSKAFEVQVIYNVHVEHRIDVHHTWEPVLREFLGGPYIDQARALVRAVPGPIITEVE